MQPINKVSLFLLCLGVLSPALALETDRQMPLEVNADSTDGMLGDGITTLSGNVEIRQGTLLIQANSAEVDKVDGKVTRITLKGDTASLQQEIEGQGLVKAWAKTISYQVGSGMVVLSGDAEVTHPQYEVSGEQLRYDLNLQHFEGNGSKDGNGRVHIRLDPEVATGTPPEEPGSGEPEPEEPDSEGNSTDQGLH